MLSYGLLPMGSNEEFDIDSIASVINLNQSCIQAVHVNQTCMSNSTLTMTLIIIMNINNTNLTCFYLLKQLNTHTSKCYLLNFLFF